MKMMTAVIVLSLIPAALSGQTVRDPGRPFEIMDNSFLVEEAFNQEAGVFQNILLVLRPNGNQWGFGFTQEWPVGSQRHQLSYTAAIDAVNNVGGEATDVGGAFAINYRLQATTESASRAAFSPRISLLVGGLSDSDTHLGVQVNLPVSKQFNDFYFHANAGYSVDGIGSTPGSAGRFLAAGSVIYRALPMVHLMVESLFQTNTNSLLLSPAVRAGINLGEKQLVLGAGVPLGLLENDDARGLLMYVSYELPFKKQ